MTQQSACQPSHAFFQNRACRYYPCHPGADPDTFNCLFCYCPLYFLDDCGGTPKDLGGVKDCTHCLRPHAPGGYEATLARLRQEFARRREAHAAQEAREGQEHS